ncbi:MAG: hypothetical protein PWQ29_591 [Verrucomicrobiota bacterium]|jgi:hypothetical protein|nr:hypothetical protein [Verrucomicrobiota bacterium]MDK2963197.1 hypothetical protein [Verrucomicrobiota bacterium]
MFSKEAAEVENIPASQIQILEKPANLQIEPVPVPSTNFQQLKFY